MNVITISREMGSGGTALARLLARRLGFALVDKDIILEAAKKARVDERDVRDYDQEGFNRAKAVLERLAPVQTSPFAPLAQVHFPSAEAVARPDAAPFNQERYLAVTQYLIRHAGRRGRTVILGRGGQIVLAGMKNALHLRVVAPLADRVERVGRGRNVSEEEAEEAIRKRDRSCARYLKHFYGRDWSDPLLYDLVINSARTSLAAAAELVANFVGSTESDGPNEEPRRGTEASPSDGRRSSK
jgi:cytidylate kinase